MRLLECWCAAYDPRRTHHEGNGGGNAIRWRWWWCGEGGKVGHFLVVWEFSSSGFSFRKGRRKSDFSSTTVISLPVRKNNRKYGEYITLTVFRGSYSDIYNQLLLKEEISRVVLRTEWGTTTTDDQPHQKNDFNQSLVQRLVVAFQCSFWWNAINFDPRTFN